MDDPLVALRASIKSKLPITYTTADGTPTDALRNASHLVLAAPLTKSTPTRYKNSSTSTATNPVTSPGDFYSLEAVYLAWHLRDAPGGEYMKQMRENGLTAGFVSITERKAVVEWLEGNEVSGEKVVAIPGGTPPGTPPRGENPPLGSSSTSADPSSSPSKRRYEPDKKDLDSVKRIRQNEVELRDRNSVLRGTKTTNFSGVRVAFAAKVKKLKEAKTTATPAPSTSLTDPTLQSRKARPQYPIIIISSSPTALITMHNVKLFLQDSTFEPSSTARARAAAEGNPRPEDVIAIYRKRTNIDGSGRETEVQSRYFVVDSVEALSKFGGGEKAWERVVCVMTTGQAWQFRPYKWKEPRQLFHHVKGFYVSWSNDPPNTKIKDWNVTELKIDPMRRHVDKSVVAHFWKTLDTWTMANKPSLIKSS
ncbi:RNA polymerase II-associated protein [Pterulicium gracile]|uniref:RNA polymerase II-associated protein n=1 Tax=Pterulicium gracile TaxID=1884261 RepID=A0A5C3R291_9AGAR|nr:RNA polymerase II-associated protein [Pterula gracilis]